MKFSQLGLILLAASALLLVACDKGSESPTAPPPKEEQADDNKPQPKVDPKEVEPKADPITPLLAPLQQAATLGTHGAARAGRAQRADLTLPIEIQRRFAAIHGDDDPDALVRDAHYYVSNENTHELFYDHIKDQGGLLIGVGTDQLFLYAGWAKSTLLVPMDFDRVITRLHHVYGILFEHATTPEDLQSYFTEEHEEEVHQWINERYTDPDEAKKYRRAYDHGRREVERRLRLVKSHFKDLDVPTFLTDQDQFDYIKMLWANGRVIPVCGDLTGERAMIEIGRAARASGVPVQHLYLSNAEVYFDYTPNYRRNINALDYADNGLILRTRQATYLGVARPNGYHYNIQGGANFAEWLRVNRLSKIGRMLDHREKGDIEGFSSITKEPIANSTPPELSPMKLPEEQ